MQILDGRVVRDKIAQDLRSKILDLRSKPKLVIIQVGDLAQSNTYIRQKVLFGEKVGAIIDHKKFPADISQENLIRELSTVNREPSVNGIIVQLPIPRTLDENKIIESIDPTKDVDGQTSTNIKLLFEGHPSRHPGVATTTIGSRSTPRKDSIAEFILSEVEGLQNDHVGVLSGFIPATTKGILTLLDYYKIPISSKHVVIVGRSSLVGKPTALALLNRDATVTICHSKTQNLPKITKAADILVVAGGKPKLITKEHVWKYQVVIDVGINVLPQQAKLGVQPLTGVGPLRGKPEAEPPTRKLVGDVDFDNVKSVVAAISPVPGGIGPMTVASLFQNLLEAYKRQQSTDKSG